jgi:glycosyltransferase involved in cell wall biosynthesis
MGGGMRMKVLHAMALGRPVLTTERGTEGLTTDGRRPPLEVAYDAQGLADSAARLLADGGERAELGRRARRFVEEHHSPRAYAARLEETYAAALAGGTR